MGAAREGCLVLVVGPSGAGKDTLLRIAARRLAAQPRIVFGRRIVTRLADAFEDHDSMGAAAFDAAQAQGAFVLSWRAHGHGYGVPAAAAAERLGSGDTIVFNVSRAAVAAARERFARVRVVYVAAPPEELARRLAARGRDPDVAARLARAEALARGEDSDLVIDNVGDPERHGETLAAFLAATLS